MKGVVALLAFILIANWPAFAQGQNPNAELDAWRDAMAEHTREAEELRQQYAADRELWRAHFEDATRPMSTGKKLLIGLAYVGDKAVTGVVNYYSSRAAIRSEMGRFDARFEAVQGNILASRTDILASSKKSESAILTGIGEAEANTARRLNTAEGNIINEVLRNDRLLEEIRLNGLPPCISPFGATGLMPCR